MSIAEMFAIVRDHYQLGNFAGTHLEMCSDTLEVLREYAMRKVSDPPSNAGSIGSLFGIPIVLKTDLPVGYWRLVVNSTNETFREGAFEDRE